MSEAHATAVDHGAAAGHPGTEHGHGEHLEVWPDAGITETAKKVPLWLVILYFGFAAGMTYGYSQQFIFHADNYPKYGPNYYALEDNAQYPDAINPIIDLPRTQTWHVGEESMMLLRATGGRVGRVWSAVDVDGQSPLPPGVEMKQTKNGFALVGTPTQAGEYSVELICRSGSGEARHVLEINVEDRSAQQ